MSKKIWIGVDVGADTMSVCAINDAGNPVFEMHLPTSAAALDAALKPIRRSNIDVIGVEAGSSSIHLARGLLRLKYPVVVFECRQVSAYLGLRGNKTDKNDARCIAEVARSGRETVSHVAIKSPECQNIRSMLTMRQQFVRMRIAGEAGMRSLFRLNGGKLVSCRTAADLRKEVSLELDRLRKVEKVDLKHEIDPMLDVCERMRMHGEALDRKIARIAKDIHPCRQFMGIPGVGPLTALSFYSAVGDPHRFQNSHDVGAFLGLVPRVRQSGTTTARLRISKRGSTLTRCHLTTAAGVHLRKTSRDTALKKWGTGLQERRGRGRARTAVARKLSVIMLSMWKAGTQYEPDHRADVRSATAFSIANVP